MFSRSMDEEFDEEYGTERYFLALRQQVSVNQTELLEIHYLKRENKIKFLFFIILAIFSVVGAILLIFYYYNFRSRLEYPLPEVGAISAVLLSCIVAILTGLRSTFYYILALTSLERRQQFAIDLAKGELRENDNASTLRSGHG